MTGNKPGATATDGGVWTKRLQGGAEGSWVLDASRSRAEFAVTHF